MVTKRKASTADTGAATRRKLKASVERVNEKANPAGFMPYKSDRANAGVKGNTKFRPRQRDPHEATPKTGDWKGSTYKTGDGDVLQLQRPHSDLSRFKSFGDRT